jgi:cytochrome c553
MPVKAKLLSIGVAAAAALATSTALRAADAAAGKAKAEAACAACHGANGVSVSDTIPNLAGQKAAYLENQLKALKAGTRRNAIMNAIAAQLSPEDMANLAAHFSAQPGATSTAMKSPLLPSLAKTNVRYPENYKQTFTMYQTVNRPDIGQVRYLYANPVALQAAREGKSLPDGSVLLLEQHAAKMGADKKPIAGPDGFFVADRLLAYAIMERQAGWGRDIPENLRNEDWQYAVYSPTRELRPGVNQGECLACHKPLDKESFTFSIKGLTEAAKKK